MTPRERVLTAFAHQQPDRVPTWFGSSNEFLEKAQRELDLDEEGLRVQFGDDFRRIIAGYAGPPISLEPGVLSRDVFGVTRAGSGCGQALNHPLANATLADVEAFPWPDPTWTDVTTLRVEAEEWGGQYAILGGEWAPFWHNAMELLGTERMFLLMYRQPELVEAVFQRLVDYYVAVNERILNEAAEVIDILFIGNDLGSQTGPMVGEKQFRRFVFPHLKRLAELGHAYQLPVMLHCCGGYEPLIPALIEAGIDAVHAVQPSCLGMDLRQLKTKYGDRLVFNGGIDSQHILIEGTPATVREGTREVLKIMMPGGGYVAGASHDTILEETPVENVVAMFEAIREFGRYA